MLFIQRGLANQNIPSAVVGTVYIAIGIVALHLRAMADIISPAERAVIKLGDNLMRNQQTNVSRARTFLHSPVGSEATKPDRPSLFLSCLDH